MGEPAAERVQIDPRRAQALKSTIVVGERPRRVDLLWGFLTVVSAAALVRGHFGGSAASTRIVLDLAFGALLAGSILAWLWFRRHPARLEITPEAVAFSHRGQSGSTRLVGPGELYVYTTLIGGTDRLNFLKVSGADEAIPLTMFDHEEVKAACRASGWRFAGDP